MKTKREESHYTAPPRWRLFIEELGMVSRLFTEELGMVAWKSFRSYTSTIPLEDKTVVMHDSRGFANTLREKLAMLRITGDEFVYIAWPGKFETHIFRGTPGDVLGALIEKAYPESSRG